jgi:hypothetical protein
MLKRRQIEVNVCKHLDAFLQILKTINRFVDLLGERVKVIARYCW